MLIHIVQTLRKQIEDMGGSFRFRAKVTDILMEEGRVKGVVINEHEVLPAEVCVLAIGHSARHVCHASQKRGAHGAEILRSGTSWNIPSLSSIRLFTGRTKIPFWARPATRSRTPAKTGAVCIPSACVRRLCGKCILGKGASGRQRNELSGTDGQNANSAIIVTVTPKDFPGKDRCRAWNFREIWSAQPGMPERKRSGTAF